MSDHYDNSTYEALVQIDRSSLAKRCVSLQDTTKELKRQALSDSVTIDGLKEELIDNQDRTLEDIVRALIRDEFKFAISNIKSRDLDLEADHINGIDDLVKDEVASQIKDVDFDNDCSGFRDSVESIVDDKIDAIEIDSSIRN